MTPGTGHGAGLRTRGAAWQGRLGASGTSRAWGGHTPLSVEGGVVPCIRVTGRGGWSRGSGGSILRGVVALAAVLCWAVAGWGQTAAPRALGSQHPLLVPHSSSGFPAPCLSSVLPNAKWAPKLQGETNQWPGSSSCQKPLPEAVPRPDAVTAALTVCPKRPRSSGPCRTCGPMVGAAGGLSSSRWSAFRLGGVGGTLGGVSAGLRGGRGRSSPPLAWSVILTLSRTRGSRCSLVAAGTQGGTDRSWQPRDPRLPSSWGRGQGPHPASGCVQLSGARQSHPPAPRHPEPVPKPVGACSSPKLGSCGGRSALSPSVWAALSHRTCRARLVER